MQKDRTSDDITVGQQGARSVATLGASGGYKRLDIKYAPLFKLKLKLLETVAPILDFRIAFGHQGLDKFERVSKSSTQNQKFHQEIKKACICLQHRSQLPI